MNKNFFQREDSFINKYLFKIKNTSHDNQEDFYKVNEKINDYDGKKIVGILKKQHKIVGSMDEECY